MAELSPQDISLAARTIIGEGGNEPYEGKAAIASVILNRLNSGRWGNSVANVVLAPKQFTTWQDRPAELAAISPNSPAYKEAASIVQGVAKGDIEDPTGGALNYAQVDWVRRNNPGALSWINQMSNPIKIGSHTFGTAPGMPQMANNNYDADKQFLMSFGSKATPSQTTAAPSDYDDDKDFLQSYNKPTAAPGASDFQNTPSNIPVPVANMTPEQRKDFDASVAATKAETDKSALQRFREAIDPFSALKTAAGTVFDKAADSWNAGVAQSVNPNMLPTFETFPSKVTTITGNEEPATGVRMSDPGKVLGVHGGSLVL